jgi:hypothetical protein
LKLNQKTRVPSLYVHGTNRTQYHLTSRSPDHRVPDLCGHPQSSTPGLLLLTQFSSLHAMPHLSVPCRPGTLAYMLESKTSKTYCHMPYRVVSCLPAQEGSNIITCPMAQDHASLLGRAPALPRVPWLWTLPPCSRGLQCCHVSHDSGSCLPIWEGSDAATCHVAPNPASMLRRASVLSHTPWYRPQLSTQEGSGAATCPTAICGPHTSRIKKCLDDLHMRLDSRVSKTCSHVTETLDT